MGLWFDPPEGWRYGFPKEYPTPTNISEEWMLTEFVKAGYPEGLWNVALKHSRYWIEE